MTVPQQLMYPPCPYYRPRRAVSCLLKLEDNVPNGMRCSDCPGPAPRTKKEAMSMRLVFANWCLNNCPDGAMYVSQFSQWHEYYAWYMRCKASDVPTGLSFQEACALILGE